MSKKCKDLVNDKWKETKTDLEKLIKAYENEKDDKELGSLEEYGLSIDLVRAGTFKDQRAGYIRYQLSWGGPADEIGFYKNGDIEYWFLDWFDGASVDITGDKVAEWLKNWVEGLGLWEKA